MRHTLHISRFAGIDHPFFATPLPPLAHTGLLLPIWEQGHDCKMLKLILGRGWHGVRNSHCAKQWTTWKIDIWQPNNTTSTQQLYWHSPSKPKLQKFQLGENQISTKWQSCLPISVHLREALVSYCRDEHNHLTGSTIENSEPRTQPAVPATQHYTHSVGRPDRSGRLELCGVWRSYAGMSCLTWHYNWPAPMCYWLIIITHISYYVTKNILRTIHKFDTQRNTPYSAITIDHTVFC